MDNPCSDDKRKEAEKKIQEAIEQIHLMEEVLGKEFTPCDDCTSGTDDFYLDENNDLRSACDICPFSQGYTMKDVQQAHQPRKEE